MHRSTTLTFTAALLLGTATAQNITNDTRSNSTITCSEGLKIFVSRGTGESPGVGATGNVTDLILSQINGSDVHPIEYPASFDDPIYFISVANGTQLLKQAVTDYAEACPDSKMALFGYSQGAQITSNTLCGQPVVWALYSGLEATQLTQIFINSQPLPQNITKNIVSTVLFGDPSHQSNATYSYGNAAGNGIFWRGDLQACEAMGSRIRSYCTSGDPFCDVGDAIDTDAEAHGNYVDDYGEEVVNYVVAQYRNGGTNGHINETSEQDEAASAASEESASSERLAMSAVAIAASLMAFFMV